MSDIQEAEGNQGNSGFADEWKRLARADDSGLEPSPRDDVRLDDAPEPQAGNSGQAETPPAPEAAPPEPAPTENRNDIWANAPAPLREAYEAERKAREKAENTIRSNNGRLSKAEREAAELRSRVLAQPAPAGPAPAANEQRGERDERLRAVSEEYEDVAKPLVDEILALRETVDRLASGQASFAEQQRAHAALQQAEEFARQEQMLSEAHGDWREVVVNPEFVAWVQDPETPQFIRDGIARNGDGIVDGKESSAILNLFKQGRSQPTTDPNAARRQRQLEGSRAVPSRVPGATQKGTPNDFDAAWAELREQERRQRQQRAI